jgi:endonuclease/exonuclease/phosphatase family metal-dependent hydrolase
VKVLFLNTRKKRIDCGTLLRVGRRPDVIVLAELLQGSQRHYEAGLVSAGFKHCSRATLHSRKRHVRVYSKLELETDERFTQQGNKLKNNWVCCRIGGVTISAVHMPTQGMKQKPFAQLRPWMRTYGNKRTLMIGDFNTDPAQDTIWGPQLTEWVNDFGWRNLWDKVPGGKMAYTFRGTRKSDKPRRIDHAFAGKALKKARLVHLPAFRLKGLSDHSGLLVIL